jgi:hypothetical protein
MTCSLYRASDRDIDRLVANPAGVRDFLEPSDPTLPRVRQVKPTGLVGLVLRLFPITITEVAPEPPVDAPAPAVDPDRSIDIEKGWHGLHFLLTGTSDEGDEPACYLVRGGDDLDDDGEIRALRPHQVRAFATHLSALTAADLTRRYDPERMTELGIYPTTVWKRRSPGEAPLEWLLECFSEVRRFVDRAAASGHGVIIDIS